ncbi:lipid II flippase MurJ [Roseobacter sp. A03A-229]
MLGFCELLKPHKQKLAGYMAHSLLTASTLVSFALLLSRLSGLIREQVLGARLGLSADTDAAVLMLTLPDLLVGLLLSGGFGAALIPALTRAEPPARVVLMQRVVVWTGAVGLGLAGILFVAMPLVLSLLAPALEPNTLINFRLGFAVSLLAVPVAAVIGVASAYLSAVGKYSVPALSVLAFNGALAVYFSVGLETGAVNFAVFGVVLLGACLLRLTVQFSRMTEALRPGRGDHRFDAGFAAQFFQGVLAYSVIVGAPVLFRSLYALNGPGDLSAFSYALRVFELPMGILIAPIVVVFLPLLSALSGPDDPVFSDRTNLAMRVAFVVGLIAALIGGVFARPIVTILFGYGEMAGDGSKRIAGIVQILLVALPFFAVFQAMATALNASHRTWLVLMCTSGALALALGFYAIFPIFGMSAATSAQFAFVSFHIAACCFAVIAVRGVTGLLETFRVCGGAGFVTIMLMAPVVFLSPRLRDDTVTISDVVLIATLGLFLLLIHAHLFFELAKLRDTRKQR